MKRIIINGVCWDAENLSINGKEYFTFNEAQDAAMIAGKRCPTPKDFEDLIALGYTWDACLMGLWIAGNHNTNHVGSLFFPALGAMDLSDNSVDKMYIEGHYVTSETMPESEVLRLGNPMSYEDIKMCRNFIISKRGCCGLESDIMSIKDVTTYGFSVRLVSDVMAK